MDDQKTNDFERKRAEVQELINEIKSLSPDDEYYRGKKSALILRRDALTFELKMLKVKKCGFSSNQFPDEPRINLIIRPEINLGPTDEEIDDLFAGWDDLDSGSSQDEPELQTTDDPQNTAPTDIQPTVVETVDTPSPDQLLDSLSAIYFKAYSGQYDENQRRKFLSISSELTDAGEHYEPFLRHFGANFEGQACKQDRTGRLSSYMQDLQIADLYYVWRWHRGSKSVGKFEGIFEGDEFNLELAKKIAAIKISAGGKNNGKGGKVDDNALCLNRDMQRKLIVLRNDAARQWQADKRRANIKLDNRKMEIERRLKDYAKGNTKARMTDEQARTHSIVWWAMKIAKGVQKEACRIYEQRTGEAICRQLLNKKFVKVLKIAPDLCNPSKPMYSAQP